MDSERQDIASQHLHGPLFALLRKQAANGDQLDRREHFGAGVVVVFKRAAILARQGLEEREDEAKMGFGLVIQCRRVRTE